MHVKPEQVLPTLMIVLDAVASVVYAAKSDVRHAIYWAAAAVLTASVTF